MEENQNILDFKYVPEAQDYVTTNLHISKNRLIFASILYFVLFLALSVIFNLRNFSLNTFLTILYYAVPLSVVFIGIFNLLIILFIRNRTKKIYQNEAPFQAEKHIVVNDDGYFEESDAGVESIYIKWHEATKITDTKKMLYLMADPDKVQMIPKRVLSRQQIRAFKRTTEKKVPSKKYNWSRPVSYNGNSVNHDTSNKDVSANQNNSANQNDSSGNDSKNDNTGNE